MKLILIFTLSLFAINSFSQEGLDDIFDDGDANPDWAVNVGFDITTLISGTFHVNGNVYYKDKVGVHFGLGVLPFGYLMDVSNPSRVALNDIDNSTRFELEGGTHMSLGFKYVGKFSHSYKWYYYGLYKGWKFNQIQEEEDPGTNIIETKVSRKKINFGSGISLTPFKHIGFDFRMGVYLGTNKFDDGDSINPQLSGMSGFDLGLGLFYQF